MNLLPVDYEDVVLVEILIAVGLALLVWESLWKYVGA